MTQFEAVVEYAGKRVKVKSDSFEELHAALAGIEELNQDAEYLKAEKSIEEIVPVYRRDADENEYYGLQDRHSRKNVTYGKKRGESMIPFFPKGAEGYYDPDAQGSRSPGPRQQTARQQTARQQTAEAARSERPPSGSPARERSDAAPSQGRAADDLPF